MDQKENTYMIKYIYFYKNLFLFLFIIFLERFKFVILKDVYI